MVVGLVGKGSGVVGVRVGHNGGGRWQIKKSLLRQRHKKECNDTVIPMGNAKRNLGQPLGQ